jgi:phospholipid/cholesterol/gamma-HCH transport system permease protein
VRLVAVVPLNDHESTTSFVPIAKAIVRGCPRRSVRPCPCGDGGEAIGNVEATLAGCRTIEVDLADVGRIDGSGAVLLARFLDRLEAATGPGIDVAADRNPEAARLIALYRERRSGAPAAAPRPMARLARLGSIASSFPRALDSAFDFTGRSAVALPKVATSPHSVDWRSLPRLVQEIGAGGLAVASAANLLVGLIIGFLGVSQLGRFGAIAFVPELVVVAHFRELGPLVTAIVVAGRSGAGLASDD